MNTRLYVGGINQAVTNEQLHEAFEPYGTVSSAVIIIDRYTDSSRGFGFVDMGNQQQAEQAIESLNGTEFFGQTLKVNMAKERYTLFRGRNSGTFRSRY